MSDNSSVSGKTTFRELVSVIDRAWEAKWAAQLVQIMLFLDLAIIIGGQPGLLGWSSEDTPVLSNLNFVIITLVSFTVYAAILTPLTGLVVGTLILCIPKITSLMQQESYERPSDHVSIYDYQKDAYEKNDQDMIAYYRERKARARADESEQRQAGNILFGTACIIVLNAVPSLLGIDTTNTLLQTSIGIVGWDKAAIISLCLFIGFWRAITTAWYYHPMTWIEHPELYSQQLKAKRAERRDTPQYPRN